jgi:hypothetical protein
MNPTRSTAPSRSVHGRKAAGASVWTVMYMGIWALDALTGFGRTQPSHDRGQKRREPSPTS